MEPSYLLTLLAGLITLVLLARVILNLIATNSAAARALTRLTDPLLAPVRRVLPTIGGRDFSPLVVILLVWIIEESIVRFVLGT